MAEEKYRREYPDRPPMPIFARVMMVLSIVHVVLSLGLHIMAITHQLVILILGIAALVGGALSVFMWAESPALRKVVRSVLIALPSVVIVFGAVSIIVDKVKDPTNTFLYLFSLFGTLSAWLTQTILVFGLPTLVAAASYGARFDRVLLCIGALLNAICVPVITFYASVTPLAFDFTYDLLAVKIGYAVYAVVFAALTFVPALGNDPDHRIRQ